MDEDGLVSLNSDPEVMRYITGGQPTSREQIRGEIILFHLATCDKHPGFSGGEHRGSRFLGQQRARIYVRAYASI